MRRIKNSKRKNNNFQRTEQEKKRKAIYDSDNH